MRVRPPCSASFKQLLYVAWLWSNPREVLRDLISFLYRILNSIVCFMRCMVAYDGYVQPAIVLVHR